MLSPTYTNSLFIQIFKQVVYSYIVTNSLCNIHELNICMESFLQEIGVRQSGAFQYYLFSIIFIR